MNREKTFEYLIDFLPLLHKSVFKGAHSKHTPHQMRLLYNVNREGEQPMKYYGKKLFISKPNMSSLVNRMIDDDLLERSFDEDDRRVIKIQISKKGISTLEEQMKNHKKRVLQKLEVLSDEDIDEMNECFEKIKVIMKKV